MSSLENLASEFYLPPNGTSTHQLGDVIPSSGRHTCTGYFKMEISTESVIWLLQTIRKPRTNREKLQKRERLVNLKYFKSVFTDPETSSEGLNQSETSLSNAENNENP